MAPETPQPEETDPVETIVTESEKSIGSIKRYVIRTKQWYKDLNAKSLFVGLAICVLVLFILFLFQNCKTSVTTENTTDIFSKYSDLQLTLDGLQNGDQQILAALNEIEKQQKEEVEQVKTELQKEIDSLENRVAKLSGVVLKVNKLRIANRNRIYAIIEKNNLNVPIALEVEKSEDETVKGWSKICDNTELEVSSYENGNLMVEKEKRSFLNRLWPWNWFKKYK